MRVLVVTDDTHLCALISVCLEFQWPDVDVVVASNGAEVPERLREDAPDLVLLDINLAGRGLEVVRDIREQSSAPVILLTSRPNEVDEVRGLELGADDIIARPFSHLVLIARLRAVLRRCGHWTPAPTQARFMAGSLAVDFEERRVTLAGRVVDVTPAEFRLLAELTRHSGKVLPHGMLLRRVWGPDFPATTDNLKVLVSRLRAKIEPPGAPALIHTERGVGYRFVRPATAAPARIDAPDLVAALAMSHGAGHTAVH